MGLEKFSFKIRDRFRNSSDYYSKTDIGITDIFDVYQGENLGDKLSLAVALYLQDSEKTLQDEEVESSIAMLVAYLKNTFNAELR